MKIKKLPERQCLGCMERKSKKDLVRVVKNNENEIFLDLTGKQNGRGAYICQNINCLKKAQKAKRLEKSLKTQIPENVYLLLEGEIGQSE